MRIKIAHARAIPTVKISAIHRYPLKSGRGQALPDAQVSAIGLRGDRIWMLIDEHGEMITGRESPELVRVDADIGVGGTVFRTEGRVPLQVQTAAFTTEQPCEVWKNRFVALQGDSAADAWFSAFLGMDCRLLYIGDVPGRRRLPRAPEIPLSFADGYPLLLIGQGSLDDLNSRLSRPVAMANFRPNVVIAETAPFIEDQWRRIRIGAVDFEVAKPCTRCIFTTVDPDRGEKSADREPLLTLAKYRRFDIGTCFGINVIARGEGVLRVDDRLQVLA